MRGDLLQKMKKDGVEKRQINVKKLTNGHISQTITLTDIILGTKVQCNKRHLMI